MGAASPSSILYCITHSADFLSQWVLWCERGTNHRIRPVDARRIWALPELCGWRLLWWAAVPYDGCCHCFGLPHGVCKPDHPFQLSFKGHEREAWNTPILIRSRSCKPILYSHNYSTVHEVHTYVISVNSPSNGTPNSISKIFSCQEGMLSTLHPPQSTNGICEIIELSSGILHETAAIEEYSENIGSSVQMLSCNIEWRQQREKDGETKLWMFFQIACDYGSDI